MIDLNADVGEGFDDLAIFPYVSSVNVACGGHAGTAETMERTVAEAARRGLAIGAHPGYPDRAGFGRKDLDLPLEEVVRSVRKQLDTLATICARRDVHLTHVKPHGALYNRAARDAELACALAETVRGLDPALALVGLAGSLSVAAARSAGLRALEEGFADRRYLADGTLVPRNREDAVIDSLELALAQGLALARGRPFPAVDGSLLALRVDTLCIHSDTPGAAAFARVLSAALR